MKSLTSPILVISLLFLNSAHSQSKEQIGRWLSDSLKIITYQSVNYTKIAHEVEATFYVDYNIQKDNFIFYFAETSTHKSLRQKTITVKIVQIYSEDIVYQNVNELHLVSVKTPYKQSTPVYGLYQLLLRDGAFVNVYENYTLKDIKDLPDMYEIFKPWGYAESYKVVSEKMAKDNDEYRSCLKLNAPEYIHTTYIDLLDRFNACAEKNGDLSETCRDIAGNIDRVFKRLPNIVVKNDENYIYEAGNALQWMFEFCKL